jgi:hypothetical protein
MSNLCARARVCVGGGAGVHACTRRSSNMDEHDTSLIHSSVLIL